MEIVKNAMFERLGRMQRQYHRHHQWKLSQGGLFIPHSYAETKPESLSWWDDGGFIMNGRRVIVWWQHPRHVYSNAIENQSWQEAGEDPSDDWLFESSITNYRKVGKSRKKIISYTSRQTSKDQRMYYDKLNAIQKRMADEGIDFDVATSWKRERLNWATGISLVVPLEVRSEAELAVVAGLARRLILGQTTLDAEFPGYRYGKADWLREQKT
jgi:hypothetical protein